MLRDVTHEAWRREKSHVCLLRLVKLRHESTRWRYRITNHECIQNPGLSRGESSVPSRSSEWRDWQLTFLYVTLSVVEMVDVEKGGMGTECRALGSVKEGECIRG